MAQAVGAASTGLDMFYGHLHSRDAMQSSRLWPRPYADEIAAASIVIDADGRRFADEGLGGIYLSNAVARLPDPLGATIVFDQAIWDGPPGRGHAQPPNPLLPEAGGTLHRAGTIAELAGLIGIAPQRLEDLVAAYNAAIDAGTLHLLSPPRRSDRYKAWPIRTAPFYALPICAAITNTMGGIVVDGNGAVLDENDTPMPGLFAAGSTVGGLDGGPHAGYVGGLIKATIALRAAEAIAASFEHDLIRNRYLLLRRSCFSAARVCSADWRKGELPCRSTKMARFASTMRRPAPACHCWSSPEED